MRAGLEGPKWSRAQESAAFLSRLAMVNHKLGSLPRSPCWQLVSKLVLMLVKPPKRSGVNCRFHALSPHFEFFEKLDQLLAPKSDSATRELAKRNTSPAHPLINRPRFDFKKFGSFGFGQDRAVVRRKSKGHARNLHLPAWERFPPKFDGYLSESIRSKYFNSASRIPARTFAVSDFGDGFPSALRVLFALWAPNCFSRSCFSGSG